MTNFDYLKSEPQFHIFADVAISAERIIHIDPEACIINCRRSMAVSYTHLDVYKRQQ